MSTSYNGWPASPTLPTRVITPVAGVSFRIADNDNVAAVFTYLAQQYNARVEPLAGGTPDDWGFAYRADRNDPSSLSCHASGTAVDFNATKHPNGVKGTFTDAQLAQMKAIKAELDNTVQCGEFYLHTTDGMHWEINVPPGGLRDIGAKLRTAAQVRPPAAKPTAGPNVEQAIKDVRAAKARPGTVRASVLARVLRMLRGLRK